MARPLRDLTGLILAPELSDPVVEATFRSLGFGDWRRADTLLQRLAGPAEYRPRLAAILPPLLHLLRECPAPDMALNNLERFARASGDRAALFRQLADSPFAIELLVALLSGSQFCADVLVRNPEYLQALVRPGMLTDRRGRADYDAAAQAELSPLSTRERRLNALRRLRRREILRIAARDLLRLTDLETIVAEISDLAAACLEAALRMSAEDLQARYGSPRTGDRPATFAVVGLGKLGGRELNYSSDVDVMFVYSDEGSCRPPAGGDGGGEPLTNREYFNRLASALVAAMQDPTPEGVVWRVDTRLRPEGSAGLLARSLQSMRAYYENWAQPWERQALIKASPVAGDLQLARRLLSDLQPFVYGKRLDHLGVADITAMRARIEPRDGSVPEVKSGPGGIRDIEFAVQAHQLVAGAEDPTVRLPGTLPALRALVRSGVLTPREHRQFHSAYVFLRTLEHRLQLLFELPVRELPSDEEALEVLARRMGYVPRRSASARQQLLAEYERHTTATRRTYEHVFHNLAQGTEPEAPESRLVLDDGRDPAEAARILAPYRVNDPARAVANLRELTYGPPHAALSTRVQHSFLSLIPDVLAAASRSAQPDLSLDNLARFVGLLGSWGALYASFRDNPRILDLLCRVGGGSRFLSDLLARHPEYLDTLLDPDVMLTPKPPEDLLAQAWERTRLDGLTGLRRFRRRELLRIGVRDLMGHADVRETMASLSDLAEAVMAALLQERRQALSPRWAAPAVNGHEDVAFAIIGVGKFGGRELHYSSDLDVLFVYEGAAPDGAASVSNHRLARRLAEELLSEAGSQTPDGRLYQVDARLRPEGRGGALAMPAAGYLRYLERRADPWERLALTRARPVAGDRDLGHEFVAAIAPLVYRPLTPEDLAALRHIKGRMERERAQPSDETRIDIKLAPGGITDVEYVVQFLQLRHGLEHTQVRHPNTVEAISALEGARLLAPAHAATLRDGYLFLREVELAVQIARERSEEVVSLEEEDLQMLSARLARPGQQPAAPGELRLHIAETMARIRSVFEDLFQVDPEP